MRKVATLSRSQKVIITYFFCIIAITVYLASLFDGYRYASFHFVEFNLSFYILLFLAIKDYYSDNLVSIRLIFNLFGFLYTNFHIIQLIEYNQSIDEYTFFSMELSYLAILSFNLVYSYSKSSGTFFNEHGYVFKLHRFNLGLSILFIASVLSEFYVVFYKIGIFTYVLASRAERSLLREGYSFFMFYSFLIPLISAISLFIYLKYRKRKNLVLFILSFIIAIANAVITASRAEILSVFLPIVFLCSYFKLLSKKKIVLIGCFGFILMGIWKSLYSEEVEMKYDSEFNTWYEICKNMMTAPRGLDTLYGLSYLKTLINLIVPFTGMESLSTWYVKNYEYSIYLAGGGRGFSSILEAYMNFRLIGVVLIYAFYGWLAKKLKPNSIGNILIFMIVITSLNMLFRAESFSLWKNMMWFKIYPILFLYFYSRKKTHIVSIQRVDY